MSAPTKTPTRAELTAQLGSHVRTFFPPVPGRTNHLDAGILVPILWSDDPVCVLTERPPTMRQHAGEICFPGGRPEPTDADLRATALREAHEEIGLSDVTIIGELSSVPLMTSDHRLHPYVGLAEPRELVPNPGEVQRIVSYSIREVLARPFIDGIPWERNGATDYAPIFETGGRLLFGATAYVFLELLVAIAPAFGADVPERVPGKYTWQDVMR